MSSEKQTSIEEALKLVPKGWLWRLHFNGKNYCFTVHGNIREGEFAEMEAFTLVGAICATITQELEQRGELS